MKHIFPACDTETMVHQSVDPFVVKEFNILWKGKGNTQRSVKVAAGIPSVNNT